MKKIQTFFTNIVHDKVLSAILALSFGLFIGVISLNNTWFQASLLDTSATTLTEQEIPTIFTEVQNIKEIGITPLSSHEFLVDFLATEGIGDSLHPFQYIVTKDGNLLVGVKDVSVADSLPKENIIDTPIDVQVSK